LPEGTSLNAFTDGVCQGQTETGDKETVFMVEDGGEVRNVIIGKDQAEGIHCKGSCTIRNVWWEKVCEDALTIGQTGAGDVSYVIGGGAFGADDKIIQHNGAGTVNIDGFFASDFGKLYRGCGNCATSHERHVVVNNVCLASGSTGVGINTNWGDTATLTNIKTRGGKPSTANLCCAFKGVPKGSEPPKLGWYVPDDSTYDSLLTNYTVVDLSRVATTARPLLALAEWFDVCAQARGFVVALHVCVWLFLQTMFLANELPNPSLRLQNRL
jgi:hypothetical protein